MAGFLPFSESLYRFEFCGIRKAFIDLYVRENYDLTPRGIIDNLGLLDVDYNTVSAYGNFGKSGLSWEQ